MQKLVVSVRLTNGHREIVSESFMTVTDAEAEKIKQLGNKHIATQYVDHIAESCGIKKMERKLRR